MNKILVLYGGIGYSQALTETAVETARANAAFLQSVFLKPEHADEALNYPFPNDMNSVEEESEPESKEREDRRLKSTNRHLFKESCEAAGIACETDEKTETSVDELIDQSAFADLILMENETELNDRTVVDVLEELHCSILVVPKSPQHPKSSYCFMTAIRSGIHL